MSAQTPLLAQRRGYQAVGGGLRASTELSVPIFALLVH